MKMPMSGHLVNFACCASMLSINLEAKHFVSLSGSCGIHVLALLGDSSGQLKLDYGDNGLL